VKMSIDGWKQVYTVKLSQRKISLVQY